MCLFIQGVFSGEHFNICMQVQDDMQIAFWSKSMQRTSPAACQRVTVK